MSIPFLVALFSPASTLIRPTASATSVSLGSLATVSNAANAYDTDNTTYAQFDYIPGATSNSTLYYTFNSQTISSAATMYFKYQLAATDDTFGSIGTASLVYDLTGAVPTTVYDTVQSELTGTDVDTGIVTGSIALSSLTSNNLSNLRIGLRISRQRTGTSPSFSFGEGRGYLFDVYVQ